MTATITKTVFLTSCVVAGMFAFSFALVPLYKVLCERTNFNSGVRVVVIKKIATPMVINRKVNIQFLTTNNSNLLWDFYSFTQNVDVHPEQLMQVVFFAKNNTPQTMTVQAIPSFTPSLASAYFHKIQCFCFEQQTLRSGQSMNMPVLFRIDKNLPPEIKAITLGYTLFEIKKTGAQKVSFTADNRKGA